MNRDGILMYSGRILPKDTVNTISEMISVMEDLAADTLCVPMVYKHSSLTYRLINKIH